MIMELDHGISKIEFVFIKKQGPRKFTSTQRNLSLAKKGNHLNSKTVDQLSGKNYDS